jgi:hypothetical protein
MITRVIGLLLSSPREREKRGGNYYAIYVVWVGKKKPTPYWDLL